MSDYATVPVNRLRALRESLREAEAKATAYMASYDTVYQNWVAAEAKLGDALAQLRELAEAQDGYNLTRPNPMDATKAGVFARSPFDADAHAAAQVRLGRARFRARAFLAALGEAT